MGFHYVHPQEASTDSEYEFCVPSFTSQVWLFTMKKVSATGGRAVELQCNVAKVFCTYSHLSLANTTLKAHYIAPDHVTVSSGRLARVLQLSMRLPLVEFSETDVHLPVAISYTWIHTEDIASPVTFINTALRNPQIVHRKRNEGDSHQCSRLFQNIGMPRPRVVRPKFTFVVSLTPRHIGGHCGNITPPHTHTNTKRHN